MQVPQPVVDFLEAYVETTLRKRGKSIAGIAGKRGLTTIATRRSLAA